MTSLEIINLALGRIGAQTISSEASTDRNAVAAVREYPFARDEVLRAFNWPSLIKRTSLDEISDIDWIASTAYDIGDYCLASDKLYMCMNAGMSSTAEPDATVGSTLIWEYKDEGVYSGYKAYFIPDEVTENVSLYVKVNDSASFNVLYSIDSREAMEAGTHTEIDVFGVAQTASVGVDFEPTVSAIIVRFNAGTSVDITVRAK